MTQIARLIGGAGTGKTTELMRILDGVLTKGVDPLQVGFVSFTKAARREASSRAAYQFGGSSEQLEQDGWFRTLHSVCFRCLGEARGSVLSDDKESTKWLEDNLQATVGKPIGAESLEESDFEGSSDASISLTLWSAARNRLEPLDTAWARAERCSDRTPPLAEVRDFVLRYEQAKRLDGKRDFTDLLGAFAGWSFGLDGHERVAPDGVAPRLPVWFFDEQQDTSALLDAVCHRLIESASWVYVVGDPFQAIYGWAGADPQLFQAWPAAQQRIMPKSFRCPAPIHELGEAILREASDYWDRGISPADHAGVVDVERFTGGLLGEVDPTSSWLLLARTNYHANRIATRLKETGVPWQPTKGLGGWNRPVKNRALNTLADLAKGFPVESSEWAAVLDVLPSKTEGGELITRGTKAKWEPKDFAGQHAYATDLSAWGGTPLLSAALVSGRWTSFVDGALDYAAARERWGYEAVTNPPIRVGTIHSAKGAEADNVLWLTTGSQAVSRSAEENGDEECRVGYVAATRARKRLIIAVEPNQRNRFKAPV